MDPCVLNWPDFHRYEVESTEKKFFFKEKGHISGNESKELFFPWWKFGIGNSKGIKDSEPVCVHVYPSYHTVFRQDKLWLDNILCNGFNLSVFKH